MKRNERPTMTLLLISTGMLVALFSWAKISQAATIYAPTCSQSAVQAAIDSANDGDVVTIPSGNCTWTGAVGWSNKNIKLLGAGMDNTVITTPGEALSIVATTKGSFRVSGITFTGIYTGDIANHPTVIQILSNGSATPVKGWRVDHIRLNYHPANGVTGFFITGMSWGVIDHCLFEGEGYVTIETESYVDADGWPPGPKGMGGTAWDWPLNLGTDEAVYIEDNIWNFTDDAISGVNDIGYGGRQVFRRNIVNHAFFQTHSTRANNRGGLKYEIYGNIFDGSGNNTASHPFLWPALIRSGTGVIFNNTVSGYGGTNNFVIDNQRTCLDFTGNYPRCDGTRSVDGNTAGEYGWPCLDQIGRGPGPIGNQPSVPLVGWNNGSSPACATGGICNNSTLIERNGDFDMCLSSPPPVLATHIKTAGDMSAHAGGVLDYVNNGSIPKEGYTPYPYPHPLTLMGSSDTTPPAPPTRVRVR